MADEIAAYCSPQSTLPGDEDKPDPYQFRVARYRDLPQADIDAFG